MPRRLKLFWASTPDHDEDWFVVARTASQAARWHEGQEGYDRGDASAQFVADIPEGVDAEMGWPSDRLIVACGGEFLPLVPVGGQEGAAMRSLMGSGARAVRFGDAVYAEGDIVASLLQERGELPDDA